MDWQNIIQELLAFSIGGVVISGVIVKISKYIFKQWLDKDIENYKIKLQMKAKQDEIMFSKLHEERAIVIKELYGKLAKLSDEMDVLVIYYYSKGEESLQLGQNNTEQLKTAIDSFIEYYRINRIYFEVDTCRMFDEFIQKVGIASYSFIYKDTIKRSDEDIKWFKNLHENYLPVMLSNLENQFRNMIGVR